MKVTASNQQQQRSCPLMHQGKKSEEKVKSQVCHSTKSLKTTKCPICRDSQEECKERVS